MMNIRHFSRTLILLCLAVFSGSWGFLVHRTINQLAIYKLPKSMQGFFYQNRQDLVCGSVAPDLRRNTDRAEAPRHFIDLEMYGDSAAWKMPLHWEDAVHRYSKDTLFKYGYVPYAILQTKEKLAAAFRNGVRDSILLYAADLGHYIGDAHVPLHLTANYDGQWNNQSGIHSLWESQIPELELGQYNLYDHHQAIYLKDPAQAIWTAIRDTHVLLKGLLDQEKETTQAFSDSGKYLIQLKSGKEFKTYSSAFAKAYAGRLGKTINQQLLLSADLTADFWYSSWVDAGKPDLEKTMILVLSNKDKKEEKMEYWAYRHNQLITKNLLFARKMGDE